jgi:hypothetical protein
MNNSSIGSDESGSDFCSADVHSNEVRVVWDSRHTIRIGETQAIILPSIVLADFHAMKIRCHCF